MIWVVGIIAVFGAIALGQRVASGNYKPIIGLFVVGASTLVALSLGRRYWLLIPLLYPFVGSIGLMPLPFSYSELGIIGASGMFVMYLCLHKQDLGFKMNWLDGLLIINLLFLLQAYVRNPAGILLVGSEIIGSRQYFTVLMGVAAYVVISHVKLSEKEVKYLPYLICVPMIIAGGIAAATSVFPALSRIIYPFYSAVNIEALTDIGIQDTQERRLTDFADVAQPVVLLLISIKPIIAFIFPVNPILFLAFYGSLLMSALSGFRSVTFAIFGWLVIASFIRKRGKDVAMMALLGFFGIALLGVLQTSGVSLPFAAQRALSFIPFVEWDEAAVDAGKESTEWRLEMWREALSSDRYIRNKVWGDGLGFRLDDFMAMQRAIMGWGGDLATGKNNEAAMIKGSFHSGPLSAIRVVGFVGMFFLFLAIVVAGYHALKTVLSMRGTYFLPGAICICVPLIYLPFKWIFVFGDYKGDIVTLVIGVAFLKMLQGSYQEWLNQEAQLLVEDVEIPKAERPLVHA